MRCSASATLLHERMDGEVVLTNPLYEYLAVTRSFPEARLYEALGLDGVAGVTPIYFTQAVWKNPEPASSTGSRSSAGQGPAR